MSKIVGAIRKGRCIYSTALQANLTVKPYGLEMGRKCCVPFITFPQKVPLFCHNFSWTLYKLLMVCQKMVSALPSNFSCLFLQPRQCARNVTRNLKLYYFFQMDIPRAPINGRGQQATPPPPPRPSQQQLLRCHGGNLANNYQRSTSAPAPATSTPGLPNSYSVVSGITSK